MIFLIMVLVNETNIFRSTHNNDPPSSGKYFVDNYLFYIIIALIMISLCISCCKKKLPSIIGENSVSLIGNDL